MDFLTKIKGRMLVCLYGIKRADMILNSWWLDDNQLLLLVTKHYNKKCQSVSLSQRLGLYDVLYCYCFEILNCWFKQF